MLVNHKYYLYKTELMFCMESATLMKGEFLNGIKELERWKIKVSATSAMGKAEERSRRTFGNAWGPTHGAKAILLANILHGAARYVTRQASGAEGESAR